MSEHIPIFCATDENYAPFASLMMKSVLIHTSSFIDFYIMNNGLLSKTKKLIQKDLKKYPNKKLHFVDMTEYDLSQFPEISHFSTNTFSRYFIPKIAPNLTKIIYLDVDIIVVGDISELYKQDLENHPLAAVPEDYLDGSKIQLKNQIWPLYKSSSSYFNAGVLLLDIPKLIQLHFTENAVNLTAQLYHKLSCADQDILNILFEDTYKKLDYRFNIPASREVFLYKKHPDVKNEKPIILHYSSNIKPWKHKLDNSSTYFDDTLRESVFYKPVIKKYRAKKKSKYYLFGFIPLFTHVTLKKQ